MAVMHGRFAADEGACMCLGGFGGVWGCGGGEEDGWRAITARKKCRVYSLE